MTGRLGAVIFLIFCFLGIARLHAAEDAAKWETQKREAMRAAGADEKLKGDIEKLFAAPSRENFYTVFWRVEKRKEFAGMIALFLTQEEPEIRRDAAMAIGKLGAKEFISDLVSLLSDPDPCKNVNSGAALALRDLHAPETVPLVMKLLERPDGRTRSFAVFTLGLIADKAATGSIRKLIHDSDAEVRVSVAFALGNLSGKDAIPELVKLLKDPEYDVRQAAIEALGATKDKAAIPPLLQLMRGSSDERQAAIYELAELGEKSIAPDAVRLLCDEDKDVRWMAVDVLGKLGERKVIPQIAKLLSDEQSWVMESAAAAMADILKERWDADVGSARAWWAQHQSDPEFALEK